MLIAHIVTVFHLFRRKYKEYKRNRKSFRENENNICRLQCDQLEVMNEWDVKNATGEFGTIKAFRTDEGDFIYL